MSSLVKGRLDVTSALLVAVAVIACVGGLLVVGDRPKGGADAEQVEVDLNRHLPLGSSVEEAEAWFDARGIKSQGIYRGENPHKVGMVGAIQNDGMFDKARIIISLSFNPDGRLEKCNVARVVYKT